MVDVCHMMNRIQNGAVLTMRPFDTLSFEVTKVVSNADNNNIEQEQMNLKWRLFFLVDATHTLIP